MTHFYNLENAEELGIDSELEMLSFLSKVFGRDYITVPFNKLAFNQQKMTSVMLY